MGGKKLTSLKNEKFFFFVGTFFTFFDQANEAISNSGGELRLLRFLFVGLGFFQIFYKNGGLIWHTPGRI